MKVKNFSGSTVYLGSKKYAVLPDDQKRITVNSSARSNQDFEYAIVQHQDPRSAVDNKHNKPFVPKNLEINYLLIDNEVEELERDTLFFIESQSSATPAVYYKNKFGICEQIQPRWDKKHPRDFILKTLNLKSITMLKNIRKIEQPESIPLVDKYTTALNKIEKTIQQMRNLKPHLKSDVSFTEVKEILNQE